MPCKKQRRRGHLPWRERPRFPVEGDGRRWKATEQICLSPSFCKESSAMHRKAQQSSARQTPQACQTHRQTAQQRDCTSVQTVFTAVYRLLAATTSAHPQLSCKGPFWPSQRHCPPCPRTNSVTQDLLS